MCVTCKQAQRLTRSTYVIPKLSCVETYTKFHCQSLPDSCKNKWFSACHLSISPIFSLPNFFPPHKFKTLFFLPENITFLFIFLYPILPFFFLISLWFFGESCRRWLNYFPQFALIHSNFRILYIIYFQEKDGPCWVIVLAVWAPMVERGEALAESELLTRNLQHLKMLLMIIMLF